MPAKPRFDAPASLSLLLCRWHGVQASQFAILPQAEDHMALHRNTRSFARHAPIFVLMVFVLIASSAIAQNNPAAEQSFSQLAKNFLPQVAAKYKIPGMAVALIHQGRIVDVEFFGVRDKASNAPMNERTVFEVGELSEPVFAFAVLSLAAEGRLDLSSPVTQYFPLPYRRNSNPFLTGSTPAPPDQVTDIRFQQITGIRALNHTSGLPDWALNDHLRLQSAPGEKWSYSGEAEVFLQRAIEQTSGQPFTALAARTVLGPFGMNQSSFMWRSDYQSSIVTGYDLSGNPVQPDHFAQPIGAVTLYTTIGDYARFLSAVLASSPRQLVHEATVSLMLSPTVTVDDSLSFSWGMGWGLENGSKDHYFFRWSGNPGASSFAIASRETGSGVIVFTNSENGIDAARDIVQTVFKADHPIFKSSLIRVRREPF